MRGRRMFSQLVQDVLRAVGSREGQFRAVIREIADRLNILEGPGIPVSEEWTAGRRRGLWAPSLWLGDASLGPSPVDPVRFDDKAKPFCHAELTVQKPRHTGGHCYLFGFSIFIILLWITQRNCSSWWLRFTAWDWKPVKEKGECVCVCV